MNRWLQAALILGSLAILLLMVLTFSYRVGYGYDLEWMEGGMLIHGLRVMNGQGLYVEPSSDFIPFIYPPLYSWLLGIGGFIFGLDYPVGRSLSFIGALLACGAVAASMRQEKANWGITAFAAAVFLSTYEDSGTFLDLVRADGILIALIGWTLVCVRANKPKTAGILLFAAFMTKHNAAIFGFPCLWWLWRYKGKITAIHFTLWSAIPAVTSIAILQYQTNGLFLTYLLDVPSNHPFVLQRFIWQAPLEMIQSMPILSGLAMLIAIRFIWRDSPTDVRLLSLVSLSALALTIAFHTQLLAWINSLEIIQSNLNTLKKPAHVILGCLMGLLFVAGMSRVISQLKEESHHFWLANGSVAILVSMVMRGHHGGYLNVLIPGMYALTIVVCLTLKSALPIIGQDKGTRRTSAMFTALALFQLWQGKWDVSKVIPTPEDTKAGDRIIARFEKLKGPLFAPHSPWYPVKAGHPPTLHLIALWDINHDGGALASGVKGIEEDIQAKRWQAVIVPRKDNLGFGVKKHYPRKMGMRSKGKALMPKTGWRVRPEIIRSQKNQAAKSD